MLLLSLFLMLDLPSCPLLSRKTASYSHLLFTFVPTLQEPSRPSSSGSPRVRVKERGPAPRDRPRDVVAVEHFSARNELRLRHRAHRVYVIHGLTGQRLRWSGGRVDRVWLPLLLVRRAGRARLLPLVIWLVQHRLRRRRRRSHHLHLWLRLVVVRLLDVVLWLLWWIAQSRGVLRRDGDILLAIDATALSGIDMRSVHLLPRHGIVNRLLRDELVLLVRVAKLRLPLPA